METWEEREKEEGEEREGEGAQRTGVEHVFPGREFVGEDGGRHGDVAEVVVEDGAAGLLPVRAEGGGGVGALGECGDEGREGGVVREAELGVALWAGWGVCGVGRVGVESWVSWVMGRRGGGSAPRRRRCRLYAGRGLPRATSSTSRTSARLALRRGGA